MKRNPLFVVSVPSVPAEGMRREGEASPEDLAFPSDERFSLADVSVFELKIQVVSKGLLCEGRIRTALYCRCDRCQRTYELNVNVDDVCHLFEDVEDEVVDLTDALREDILLVVPQHTLCQEQCRGLCSRCGHLLNEGECGCDRSEPVREAWKELDKLNLPNE